VQFTQPRQATHRVHRRQAKQPTQPLMAIDNQVRMLPATATLPAVATEPAIMMLPAVATEPATATLPAVATEPATATLPAVATEPATAIELCEPTARVTFALCATSTPRPARTALPPGRAGPGRSAAVTNPAWHIGGCR
jgi:hypothetical protein